MPRAPFAEKVVPADASITSSRRRRDLTIAAFSNAWGTWKNLNGSLMRLRAELIVINHHPIRAVSRERRTGNSSPHHVTTWLDAHLVCLRRLLLGYVHAVVSGPALEIPRATDGGMHANLPCGSEEGDSKVVVMPMFISTRLTSVRGVHLLFVLFRTSIHSLVCCVIDEDH